MSAYEMLSEPIRKFIRDKGWEALRPIQEAAIIKILSTDQHYILVSPTASGKTEAAFLPVLSAADFTESGVQVLYISPLIALINDQFQRAESLCEYLDIPVTRWHGEASESRKKKLLTEPRGILLITPESIEAMFVNRPMYARSLFSHLKFIIIDEIHSFLGTDRGIHLQSLIARIGQLATQRPARIIGLSATLGSYDEAKRFTGEPERTKVLKDNTRRQIESTFAYWPATNARNYPQAFIADLYEATKDQKVLLFPNSRAKAEELAFKLREYGENKKGTTTYFVHHSSVDKEEREYIESFAKNNKYQSFCIICTSTLELGIDIGSINLVVQVDATHSVSSLIQRTGRSGRQTDVSRLLVYATNPWSLLQAIACRDLYQEGFVEPLHNRHKPYDILFHQLLSELMASNGMGKKQLVEKIRRNAAFCEFEESAITTLIDYMIQEDYVEYLKRELIVGYHGELLTNKRDFYAMFTAQTMMTVIQGNKKLGTIPHEASLQPGAQLLLGGKVWKITHTDIQSRRLTVVPGFGKGQTTFAGNMADVHPKVEEKMLELLCIDDQIKGLDTDAQHYIDELRLTFKQATINDFQCERPAVVDNGQTTLYVFAGSRIYDTLVFLLRNQEVITDKFKITLTTKTALSSLVPFLQKELKLMPSIISELMNDDPDRFYLGKWGRFLPLDFKKHYVLQQEFDIAGTAAFLNRLRLVGSH